MGRLFAPFHPPRLRLGGDAPKNTAPGSPANAFFKVFPPFLGGHAPKNHWLFGRETGWRCSELSNIEILRIMPPVGKPRSTPIADAYQTIFSFLVKKDAQVFGGALILYLAGKGAHTVFLGYDGDFFIRDSNYSRETGNKASFDFTFNANSPITE